MSSAKKKKKDLTVNDPLGKFYGDIYPIYNSLPSVQCYHLFSNSKVVHYSRNNYVLYCPQMVTEQPFSSWTIERK